MEYNFLTLWEGKKKKELLDAVVGNFTGNSEELVVIEEIGKGYGIVLNVKKEEVFEAKWHSPNFTAKYYNLLVEDINNDGKDELVIVDSMGIRVLRWHEGKFDFIEKSMDLDEKTFLGINKGDMGQVLMSITTGKITYFRVGKSSLEELHSEKLMIPLDYAITADLDNNGSKELLLCSSQGSAASMVWFKVREKGLEILGESQLTSKVKALAVANLEGNKPVVLMAGEEGNLIINKIEENALLELGSKDFSEDDLYTLVTRVTEPGLVTVELVPTLSHIKVIRTSSNLNNIAILTEKGKLFIGNLSAGDRPSLFKPVTFMEMMDQSHEVKLSKVLEVEGDILDLKTEVASLEEKVGNGKVDVLGKVSYKYLYRSKEDERILSGEESFDFTTSIDNATLDMEDWVQATVQSCETTFERKENKVEVETTIPLDIKYYDQRKINFLTSLRGKRFNDFVETTIQIEEPRVRRRAQTTVRGTIVSDVPIEKILETNARVRDLSVQALNNRAVVRGILEVEILFVADTLAGDQPVFFLEDRIPFTVVIDVPGLRPGTPIFVRPVVEFVKSRLIDSRTIEVTAVLGLEAKVTVISPVDVIIDCPKDDIFVGNDIILDDSLSVGFDDDLVLGVQDTIPGTKFNSLEVEFPVGIAPVSDIIDRRQTQVLVEEVVDIPPQKPDVEIVLSVDARARVEEVRVIPDKVIVRGVLRTTTRYVADTLAGDQPVHAVSADIPFTTFVDMRGVRPGTRVNVFLEIEYIKGRRHNGRSIEIVAIVKVLAQAFRRVRALVRA